MVKLYVSEAANRIADRALQIFGGRGYMRENVAERFFENSDVIEYGKVQVRFRN